MMRVARILVVTVLVVALSSALAISLASAADAKPAPFAATPKPRITVQLWPAELAGAYLVVGATLPTSTPLPATVDLPLPKGATPMWVGEITGLGPEEDIEQSATIVTSTGGRALRVELMRTHEVQYDAAWTAPVADGARRTSTLAWVQTASASGVDFRVKLPANAGDVTIRPAPAGEPDENDAGERLWSLPPATLAVGDTFDLTVDYTLGTTAAAASTAPGSRMLDALLYVLTGALVVTGIALFVAVRVQSSHARS